MGKSEEIYWRAECSFADSHKNGMLSEILGVSWPEAVGIVTAFFGQVRRQFPDGNVTRITDDMLRHWCRSKKISMTALVGATWVDKTPENELHVHGWDERYSEIALKRMAEKEKKRYQRAEEKRRLSGQKRDNVPILSPDCPQNVPAVPTVSPPYARAGDSERDSEKEHQTTLVAVPTTPARDYAKDLLAAWNGLAVELNLPRAESLSKSRRAKAAARVRDGVLDRWAEVSAALRGSRFHLGDNQRGWRADFDWLCTEDGWRKLLERSAVGPPVLSAHRVETPEEFYRRTIQ